MARGRGRGWGRRGTAPRPATGRRRAHFHRGGAPRPAPGRPGRPGGEGGSGGAARLRARRTTSPRVLQPSGRSFRRIPGPRKPDTRRRALPLPPSASRAGVGVGAGPPLPRRDRSPTPLRRLSRGPVGGGADCPQCAPGVVAPSGPGGTVGHASPDGASARGRRRRRLPTRPVLKHGPRSLTRARVRGSSESRRGAMKVKGPARGPEVGSRGLSSPPRAHHRPVSPAAPGRWSTSVRVRTRKMVNYAWAGRSQRKLWWRSVAVLTCKSVVRPGYRGERLIEPSSSWFPPKFPSG